MQNPAQADPDKTRLIDAPYGLNLLRFCASCDSNAAYELEATVRPGHCEGKRQKPTC